MNKRTEAKALCEEYVSDHPGCALRELQDYVMQQTGCGLEAARKARKEAGIKLIRKGKGWACHLADPEASVDAVGWMRMKSMMPKGEWRKLMNSFKDGNVELVVVPTGAEVIVDGVQAW